MLGLASVVSMKAFLATLATVCTVIVSVADLKPADVRHMPRRRAPINDERIAPAPLSLIKQMPNNRQPPGQVPQDEVIQVETRLITLFLTALDKDNHFVTSLKQTDIRLLENGVQREIFTFMPANDRPLTVILLIDVSQSQRDKLPEEKAVALAFVRRIIRSKQDRVGVVSFTADSMVEQPLTGYMADVRRTIERLQVVDAASGYQGKGTALPPGSPHDRDPTVFGKTAIWDAVWLTCRYILSPLPADTRKVIVLLTDGEDTSSRAYIEEAIEAAVQTDAVVYPIGIGDRKYSFGAEQKTGLSRLAEMTGGLAFFPNEGDKSKNAFGKIEKTLRAQYLIAYSPSAKASGGAYPQVEIELTNSTLRKQGLRLLYRHRHLTKTAPAEEVDPGHEFNSLGRVK